MPRVQTNGVPKYVLTGRVKRFRKVANLYKALLIQAFYRRIHASLWLRGRGQVDEVAGKWKKLKKKTIEIKSELRDPLRSYEFFSNWYHLANLNDGISPADHQRPLLKSKVDRRILAPKHQEIVDRHMKGANSPSSKRLALRKAYEEIKQDEYEREFVYIINYRTGRLFASAYPGKVANNRYYPSSIDQDVKYTRKKIIVSFDKIPYANSVDQYRKLLPEDTSPWLLQAHNEVIGQVQALYDSMLRDYKERKRLAKEQDSRKRIKRLKARGDRRTARGKTTRNRRPTNLGDIPF